MKTITNIMGKVTCIFAIAGIVCFFLKCDACLTILYACAGFCFLHSIFNVAFGDQNNLVTEAITLVIGALIAAIFNQPILPMLALFVCFGECFFLILALLSILRFLI